MKLFKLSSILLMGIASLNAFAQNSEWDDDIYSTKKKKSVPEVQEYKAVSKSKSAKVMITPSNNTRTADRDVDEYNRRGGNRDYTSQDTNDTIVPVSDTEYTERIVKFHDPARITIVGADEVNLYVDDDGRLVSYDTDYSSNYRSNVNINLGFNSW